MSQSLTPTWITEKVGGGGGGGGRGSAINRQ